MEEMGGNARVAARSSVGRLVAPVAGDNVDWGRGEREPGLERGGEGSGSWSTGLCLLDDLSFLPFLIFSLLSFLALDLLLEVDSE